MQHCRCGLCAFRLSGGGRGRLAGARRGNRALACGIALFRDSGQRGTPDPAGYKGFYHQLLDMQSGLRTWRSELSMIDTALLIAGALTARMYFDAETVREAELREIADELYRRIDWRSA
jgi:hypothetical protein